MTIEIEEAPFKNQSDDSVTFVYKPTGESKIEGTEACYANLFGYQKYCLKCLPTHDVVLSDKIYSTFMQLAKDNDVLHKNCFFYTKKGKHFLFFPEDSYTKGEIYPSLCLYRYTDSSPLIPWEVTQLVKQGINFFQALYYSVSMHSRNSGHDFFSANENSYGVSKNSRKLNVTSGVAVSLYFKQKNRSSSNFTQGDISSVISNRKFDYFFCDKDNFLSREYVPLYENPKITCKQFNEKCRKLQLLWESQLSS